MSKTASTREIIDYLEAYEKTHGVGAVESIGTVCSGSRDVEYLFDIEDKNGTNSRVEIPTLQKETLWNNNVSIKKEASKELKHFNCYYYDGYERTIAIAIAENKEAAREILSNKYQSINVAHWVIEEMIFKEGSCEVFYGC